MAFNGSGCSRSTSGTAERGLKRTPWTLSEDTILREYVTKHGEGNWDLIQKKSGLSKSGKSCRNRWANYLRPNLKKGAFSAEEEKLIIELHGKLGNKWASIAAQLSERTDNEVKNYWNIRMKKCQRTGLAIHPQEMSQINQPLNRSPLPTFSSLLASFQPQDPNLLRFSNSVVSPSINDPLPNMHQILPNSLPALPDHENDLNFGFNRGPNKGVLGLPSMQSPQMVTSTVEPFSIDYVIASPNNGAGGAFVVVGSEFMQENKELRDGVMSLDEELGRLLDAPLSVPIPEWDDLDPRPF